MPEKVTVIGAGGHARSVIRLLKLLGYQIDQIMDSSASLGEKIMDVPVVPSLPVRQGTFILAIGDNQSRSQYFKQFKSFVLADLLVHPGAHLDPYAMAGRSNLFFYGCYVGPNVRIGLNNIINTKAIIEHEAIVGDHTHISVGSIVLGRAKVGSRCMIGSGAVIRDGVSVCDDVVIGANSFVSRNIDTPGTYVGSPVRKV